VGLAVFAAFRRGPRAWPRTTRLNTTAPRAFGLGRVSRDQVTLAPVNTRDAPEWLLRGGGPSSYHLRGDESGKPGEEVVRIDREMLKVVVTDREMLVSRCGPVLLGRR
jgi:hypothetical protein